MLLSVVVVTYRDPDGVRRTLRSLERFDYFQSNAVEVLVQDGYTSPDFGHLLAREFRGARVASVSDNGIYYGMNAGLARSRGTWVWFLNGGDTATMPAERLIAFLEAGHLQNRILCFDFLLVSDSTNTVRRSKPVSYLRHALPTSHQAILYPGDAARRLGYDTRYKLAGDYAFTVRLHQAGWNAVKVRGVVAAFNGDGLSSRSVGQIAFESGQVHRDLLNRRRGSRGVSRALFVLSAAYRRFRY